MVSSESCIITPVIIASEIKERAKLQQVKNEEVMVDTKKNLQVVMNGNYNNNNNMMKNSNNHHDDDDDDDDDDHNKNISNVKKTNGNNNNTMPDDSRHLNDEVDIQRLAVLSYDQVHRLNSVMNEIVSIQGRGNFPTIEVTLKDLVNTVRGKLEADCCINNGSGTNCSDENENCISSNGIGGGSNGNVNGCGLKVKDIRLNGGAATYVLDIEESWQTYNDLDLIFAVELSSGRHFDRVKTAVLNSLLDLLPEGVSRKRISTCSLKEAYVSKMVKVNNEGDCWSLISLGNSRGGCKNVELKFVDTMRRPFEFSVDSFQIVLDSLFRFSDDDFDMCENLYPTVVGESVYGDFQEALYHLQKRLIATRNPEEIRGGGLLKYCNLLVRNYQPAYPDTIKMLERYMCSRFFIDFPDINQQRCKLENYLWNHFIGPQEEALKYQYLILLRHVVDESTVCLMNHERRQTLALIDDLAYQVYYYSHHPKTTYFHPSHPPGCTQTTAYLYTANGYYYPTPVTTVIPASCNNCCNPYMMQPPPPHHHHHHCHNTIPATIYPHQQFVPAMMQQAIISSPTNSLKTEVNNSSGATTASSGTTADSSSNTDDANTTSPSPPSMPILSQSASISAAE